MRDDFERALTWLLAFALVVSIVGVAYVATTPQETNGRPYTEFYVLNSEGNASNYPTNLSVGETGSLIVGISNHEDEPVTYTVALTLENRLVATRTVDVAEKRTWRGRFSFAARSPGDKRLQIVLYRGQDVDVSSKPYRSLRLWISVRRQ